jgi:hypothetical protein
MNRLEFSCFADFFVRIFKTKEEYGFLYNPPVERTLNSMEQKTRVFCSTDVQEFHLWVQLHASFDTVDYEGRQMKQRLKKYHISPG